MLKLRDKISKSRIQFRLENVFDRMEGISFKKDQVIAGFGVWLFFYVAKGKFYFKKVCAFQSKITSPSQTLHIKQK